MIRIRVMCSSTDLIDPKKLIPFQGELKTLEKKDFRKLATSIIESGFTFPEYAWKSGGKAYTMDGHQRTRVILELLKNGWTNGEGKHDEVELVGGKVPVVWVKAANKKAAKKLVLAAMSQYGKYTEDSIYQFIHESELEWKEVKKIAAFPAINMGKLEKGWFDPDFSPESAKGDVEFSEFIDEANNYVVLLFSNDIDWLNAQTHFGIAQKTARRQDGKPWTIGIGRVINGGQYLSALAGAKVATAKAKKKAKKKAGKK